MIKASLHRNLMRRSGGMAANVLHPGLERMGCQVAERQGPTLRSQWLGQQLRDLREAASLHLKDAGDYLQRDASTVSRFETGIYPARMPDVLALLDLYGVSDERRREGLLKLSRDAWQAGWWDGYASELAGGVIDYAWLESRAHEIRSFDAMSVPGVMQTPDYARAIITAADPDADADQIERWIEFRLARQQALEAEEGLRAQAVLDESVLHRVTGGRTVMRAQLNGLAELASRPNIDLRVLPFRSGAHASPEGLFWIFSMPDPYPDIGCVDSAAGVIYVEADRAKRLMLKFERIQAAALGSVESVELISAVAETMLGTEEA